MTTPARKIAPGAETEQPYINPLLTLVREAQRSLPFRDRHREGLDPVRIPKPAAAMRNLVLTKTAVRVDRSGRIEVGNGSNSAGATMTIDRAVFESSRFAQAGGNLVFLPEPAAPEPGGLVVFNEAMPFVVVDPATFEEVTDEDGETPISSIPAFVSEMNRAGLRSFGVTYKLTRAQQKARGEQQTAEELMQAIVSGMSRIVDKLAMEAILANTPEAFTLAKAASAGLRIADMRGLVGTAAAGAAFRADGQLTAAGMPAELTEAMTQTVVGDFRRAAAVIGPDAVILASRLNVNGDVTVTAWLSVDAVCPDAGKFWTVGA